MNTAATTYRRSHRKPTAAEMARRIEGAAEQRNALNAAARAIEALEPAGDVARDTYAQEAHRLYRDAEEMDREVVILHEQALDLGYTLGQMGLA